MSTLGSVSRSGLALVLSLFGGFSGDLTLGGMTIGGNIDPGGITMSLRGCWIIPLGDLLMSYSFQF